MAGTCRLDAGRVLGHIHVHGPLERHLPIEDLDGVPVLCDAIDRTVERPVEDDAGGLAPHARVVLDGEGDEARRSLLAGLRELAASVEPWPPTGSAAPAPAADP